MTYANVCLSSTSPFWVEIPQVSSDLASTSHTQNNNSIILNIYSFFNLLELPTLRPF